MSADHPKPPAFAIPFIFFVFGACCLLSSSFFFLFLYRRFYISVIHDHLTWLQNIRKCYIYPVVFLFPLCSPCLLLILHKVMVVTSQECHYLGVCVCVTMCVLSWMRLFLCVLQLQNLPGEITWGQVWNFGNLDYVTLPLAAKVFKEKTR